MMHIGSMMDDGATAYTIQRCNETAVPVFCTVSAKSKKDYYEGKFKE